MQGAAARSAATAVIIAWLAGGEPRARRCLRVGPCHRVLLSRDRTGAVRALLATAGAAPQLLRLHARRLAGAGGGPPGPEPIRHDEPAAAVAAALRLLHVLFRHPDAGGVLVPAATPAVDGAERRRRLDVRLCLDREPARHDRRPSRRPEPRRHARRVPRPELRVGPEVRERDHRLPAGERRAGAPRPALALARGRASGGRARPWQPGPLLFAQGRGHAGRARRAAGPRAPAGGGGALRRSRGLHDHGRGDDARGSHGLAARFPRPDGRGGVPPQRLPGEVHRRRFAGDVPSRTTRPRATRIR